METDIFLDNIADDIIIEKFTPKRVTINEIPQNLLKKTIEMIKIGSLSFPKETIYMLVILIFIGFIIYNSTKNNK